MPKAARRKNVHLVFKAHAERDTTPYFPRRALKKFRAFVNEKGLGYFGTQKEYVSTQVDLPEKPETVARAPFMVNARRFLSKAHKKRLLVVPGERAYTKEELEHLKYLLGKADDWGMCTFQSRNFRDIKKYFAKWADYNAERHRLIRRAISEAPKPAIARYGSSHSILSRELQKEGIESMRTMKPQVFSWDTVVLRKLLVGKEVSDIDYKQGFVAALWETFLKPNEKVQNDSQTRFFNLLQATLIKRLTEEQLDGCLNATEKELIPMIFKANGLKPWASRKELEEFLEKYSSFYRRQLVVARMKRKAGIREALEQVNTRLKKLEKDGSKQKSRIVWLNKEKARLEKLARRNA